MDYRVASRRDKARFYSPVLNRFIQPDSIVPDPYNSQSWNRFSYVGNNPIRYNDPTGNIPSNCGPDNIYCGGLAENDYYSRPAPTNEKIIKPKDEESGGNDYYIEIEQDEVTCGQAGVYSASCNGWHEYRVENVVCPVWLQCTEEEMIDYMLRFAYPNQDPSRPAVDQGVYTVGIPIIGFDLDMMGKILFETGTSGLATTNITLPTHILYDGVVDRTASQNVNGHWVVTTEGYGNNRILGMDVANEFGGPILFNIVDIQMTAYIVMDQLFGQ